MIVVCGEALVDLVPESSDSAGEPASLAPRLGGGPYNVAISLGRLAVPVAMLTRLSTDQFGDKLLERLRLAKVDTSAVQRGPEPTTLAVVGLDEDGSARYSFHTAGTAERLIAEPDEFDAEFDGAVEAVSFGTLSMVLEPGASVYERVLHREARRGRVVVLDPNIRADMIENADAYRERFRRWLPSVSLLKLSVEDAAWLAGADETDSDERLFEVLRSWQRLGPAAVVLTTGAEGLTVLTPDGGVVRVDGVRAEVADTIGAGDTVQAALLAWLQRNSALSVSALRELGHESWRAALRFAAEAAAVTVSRPGADPPFAGEV